jgi:hypothetical protein
MYTKRAVLFRAVVLFVLGALLAGGCDSYNLSFKGLYEDGGEGPGPVTGLLGVPDTGQVTLSWTDPPGGIAHITVSWSPDDGTQTVAPGIRTCTVTGLTNGVTYTFTVAAVDGGGKTGAARAVTVKVTDTLNSVEDVEDWFDTVSGTTPGTPAVMPPLDFSGDFDIWWPALLQAIADEGEYVELDLTYCGMGGASPAGQFDPDYTVTTGKTYITALTLPAAAESISAGVAGSYGAFRYFTNLTTVSGANVETIGEVAFFQCPALTTVDLPKAEIIGNYAFNNCDALTTVELPKATSIGTFAFNHCDFLTTVKLPAALTIGDRAFYNCTRLATVDLPKAESIGTEAFLRCDDLITVELPAAEFIGDGAFYDCTNLATVTLPEAESIGYMAFYQCIALTAVELPEALIIGNYAFNYCTSLATVELPKATSIGRFAFNNCDFLTTVKLPAALTIGDSAFYQCTNLTTVELPAAETIGDSAFYQCTSLTIVELPAAETIGAFAFTHCTGLTTVTLPEAASIGASAFYRCTSLLSLTFGKDAAPWPTLGANVFGDTNGVGSLTIYVPSGTLNSYMTAWGVILANTPAGTNPGVYGTNHRGVRIME